MTWQWTAMISLFIGCACITGSLYIVYRYLYEKTKITSGTLQTKKLNETLVEINAGYKTICDRYEEMIDYIIAERKNNIEIEKVTKDPVGRIDILANPKPRKRRGRPLKIEDKSENIEDPTDEATIDDPDLIEKGDKHV